MGVDAGSASPHRLPRSPSWGGPHPQFAPFTHKLGQPFNDNGRGEPLWATKYPRQPPPPPPPPCDDGGAASADGPDGGPTSTSSNGGAAQFDWQALLARPAAVSRCPITGGVGGVVTGRASVPHRRSARDRVLARYSEDGGSIVEFVGSETSVPLRQTAAKVLRRMAAPDEALAPPSPLPSPRSCAGGGFGFGLAPGSPRAPGGAAPPTPKQAPPPKMPSCLRVFLYVSGDGDVVAALLARRRGGAAAARADGLATMAVQRAWVCEREAARAGSLVSKLFDAVGQEYACSTRAAVCEQTESFLERQPFDDGAQALVAGDMYGIDE